MGRLSVMTTFYEPVTEATTRRDFLIGGRGQGVGNLSKTDSSFQCDFQTVSVSSELLHYNRYIKCDARLSRYDISLHILWLSCRSTLVVFVPFFAISCYVWYANSTAVC